MLAVLAGLAVVLLLLLLFSLLISNIDASEELVAAMGCVSLCAGSFTAGFVAAKRRRCKGLLIGLACGIAMYLVTFLIGLLLLQSFAAAGTFSNFSDFTADTAPAIVPFLRVPYATTTTSSINAASEASRTFSVPVLSLIHI